jgi:hypothetical protein
MPTLGKQILASSVETIMSLELDPEDFWFNRIRAGYIENPYYRDVLCWLKRDSTTSLPIDEQRRFQARAQYFFLQLVGLLTHTLTGT